VSSDFHITHFRTDMHSARATSAAPRHFRPFEHEPSKQTYSDGGIYFNNPVSIAESERKVLWPEQQDQEPDVVVSLGTAQSADGDDRRHSSKWRRRPKGPIANNQYLLEMSAAHIAESMNTEQEWNNYLNSKSPTDRPRFIRLNPTLNGKPPKLDEVDKLEDLHTEVQTSASDWPLVKSLARRLIACCFYFVVHGGVTEFRGNDTFEVSGIVFATIMQEATLIFPQATCIAVYWKPTRLPRWGISLMTMPSLGTNRRSSYKNKDKDMMLKKSPLVTTSYQE
jgi:hypothetical protein